MSASGAKNASLAYDPLGRLYQVTSGANTTRFVYDGDRLIAEYNGSGTLLRRYVHGAGVDEPLVWYEGAAVSSATRRYLHANHQGSIVATSNAAGAKLAIHAYDPYGVTAAGNTGRFQYTGQVAILELGLLYYKARFYNPALGRFMQTDPIGYEDDLNIYTYVGNDPLNLVDPKGLCSSVADSGKRADCLEKREKAVDNAKEHLAGQSVRTGAKEAAYIATYNEETEEVSVRTGDAAGQRTNEDVAFTDDSGKPLVARPDGRIVERGDDGSLSDTDEIVLATGHGHPSHSGGGRINVVDNANESIRSNPGDKALSRIAPAVIKTPSGKIRVFWNGKEIKDEQ